MSDPTPPRWDEIENKDDAGSDVSRTLDWLRKNDSARLNGFADSMSRYEGRKLGGLSAAAYLQTGPYTTDLYSRLVWNIPRSLCQTVQAKIAGKNRPKVSFVTSAASWQQRRRAYHLDRFAEAQFHERQGQHENIWELGALMLMHALVLGDGFAYVYADAIDQHVAVETVYPWQVFVDSADAANGRPQMLFIVRPFDKQKLLSLYPGEKAAINQAKGIGAGDGLKDAGDAYYRAGARAAQQVEVIDAYVLPSGEADDDGKVKPGMHLRYIDGKTLEREDWARDEFPLVRLRWSPELQGYWSQSLIQEVSSISDEINHVVQRLSECVRLTQKAVCLSPKGCVKPEDLGGNDDCTLIEYDETIGKPEWVSPAPFDAATVDWLKMNMDQCFAIPGVSPMSATSRKEQGITASVAMRTLQDVETERFMVQQNAYEQLYVAICRHMIACTRDLAADNPDYSVTWPGESFLKEIKWRDVDLPDDQYVMRADPVSHLKNTPADRLQLAQDMYGAGNFSKQSLDQSVLYLNTRDHLSGGGDKQEKLVNRYIESWLDASPEKLESGEFVFRSPFPYLNLPAAMLQVAEAYVEAQLDEAPDFNLDFFLRFIEQSDEIVQARAAEAAAQAQAAAPPMVPAGMPGMAGPPSNVVPMQQPMGVAA